MESSSFRNVTVCASETFWPDWLHNHIEHVADFGAVSADTCGCGCALWANPVTFFSLVGELLVMETPPGVGWLTGPQIWPLKA